MVTVSRPVNGISVNGNEYLLGDDGKPLVFGTVKEALRYLFDHNYTFMELLEYDFNIMEG